VHTAAELTRLKSVIARLENVLVCIGIELVLDIAGLHRELTLLTMSAGAGVFILGGLYGLPEFERLSSGIGSRKEHAMRRGIIDSSL
jgi:hypothetical protein